MKILLSASFEAAAVRLGKSRSDEEAVADALEIDPGARAEEPLDELLGAHFEAEDGDRLLLLDGDVLGDVHGERGLAHAGARGDDEHLRAVQPVGHLVELAVPGGEAGDGASALVEFLDGLDGFHDLLLHREGADLEALAGDLVDLLLDLVEERGDVVLLIVGAGGVLRAGGDDAAQRPFLLENLDVIGRVGRRGDEGEQLRDEGGAADLVEQVAVAEHLRERDEIDRLRGVPELEQHGEDTGVGGDVEALGGDAALDAEAAYLARGEEEGTEDALLGVGALW